MRPHVLLVLTFAAVASAATIPAQVSRDFDKKITEVVKDVLEKDSAIPENVSSEQELIDQANVVKDVENNLRKQVPSAEDIPVNVVVEDVKPSLKTNDEKKDCDKTKPEDESTPDIKRVEIDLKNPGKPQRQEHETQNPEHNESEQDAAAAIKQSITNTENAFNEGLKGIANVIQWWTEDQETVATVKQNIQTLQDTVMEHINKLNSTIQSYWKPETIKDSEKETGIKKVENELKVLENNFESGVEGISNGFRVLTVLKSEVKDDASTTAKPASNPLFPFFQIFQTSVQNSISNLTTSVQNFFQQNTDNVTSNVNNSLADEAATPRPTVWQGIQNSIQGILNRPGQAQSGQPGAQNDEPAPSGPLVQAIQNNPIVQSVINFIQPKPSANNANQAAPQKPADAPQGEGSNVVPVSEDKPKPDADGQQQKQKPEQEPQTVQAPERPIQQIIQKNPIVQGITGAVQKIQQTITNPVKPRDTVKEGEKGYGHYGHGGHRPADGHNNDSVDSGVVKSEIAKPEEKKEQISEEPAKEPVEEKQPIKETPVKKTE